MRLSNTCLLAVMAAICFTGGLAIADITDFDNWTLIQDPAHSDFTAVATAPQASLFAGAGAIPPGTDIGFGSINGNTVATSTAGFFFDANNDVTMAIDFDLSFVSASGALGLGFGVGEDVAGVNSAGIAMVTNNGIPFLNFAGAARINDVNQSVQITSLPASLTGSLFIQYDSATGDIILGASQTAGDAAPTAAVTFADLQNSWNGDHLLASFLIRSEIIPFVAPSGWTGGDATAMFTNFRVLNGSLNAIPEPAVTVLASLMLVTFCGTNRRRKMALRDDFDGLSGQAYRRSNASQTRVSAGNYGVFAVPAAPVSGHCIESA